MTTSRSLKRSTSSDDCTFNEQGIIGTGRFGKVYRGVKEDSQEPIAVKVYLKKYKKMCVEEAELLTLIGEHPNICQLISFTSDHLVLRLIEGKSLLNFYDREDILLSKGEFISIAKDLCSALEFLQQKNIVHHDLKLDNSMVNKDGRALLIDFSNSHVRSKRNVTVGSCLWAPPELFLHDEEHETFDCWSLGMNLVLLKAKETIGIIKYRTQEFPFVYHSDEDKYNEEIVRKFHSNKDEHNFFNKMQPLEPLFKAFLECCLQVNPTKRFGAAQLLKHEFLADKADHESLAKRIQEW
jgi:p21-activated kinase 1